MFRANIVVWLHSVRLHRLVGHAQTAVDVFLKAATSKVDKATKDCMAKLHKKPDDESSFMKEFNVEECRSKYNALCAVLQSAKDRVGLVVDGSVSGLAEADGAVKSCKFQVNKFSILTLLGKPTITTVKGHRARKVLKQVYDTIRDPQHGLADMFDSALLQRVTDVLAVADCEDEEVVNADNESAPAARGSKPATGATAAASGMKPATGATAAASGGSPATRATAAASGCTPAAEPKAQRV